METIWNIAASAAFLLAFGALTLRWLWASGAVLSVPFARPLPQRAGEAPSGKELWGMFGWAILFRCAVAVGSLLLYNALSGNTLGLGELPALWARWDAPHYIKLVDLGYAGYVEDGQHLFLVFYPLYVWLVRGLRLLIPNTALAGMTVSFLCFGWGSVYFYRLGCEEYGKRMARRALALLWVFPFSFFFGGIMTESLFLLTTAAALWHIRNHRWGRFALWGALAAMTRMMGLILIGAAVAELVNDVKPFSLPEEERGKGVLAIVKRLPLLCAPVLGTLVYFGLNWHVTGDPLAFTVMQRHWSQGFMWFPRVLAYLAKNAFGWYNPTTRWEMWIPELVLFPLFALLLWRSWRTHRSMFTLYAFVYLILNYCLSWLLSAGRYLSCDLPCFYFLACELENKPKRALALGFLTAALQCWFLFRYLSWGQVM